MCRHTSPERVVFNAALVPFHRGDRGQLSTKRMLHWSRWDANGLRLYCRCFQVASPGGSRRIEDERRSGTAVQGPSLAVASHIAEFFFGRIDISWHWCVRTPSVHRTEQHLWPNSLSQARVQTSTFHLMCQRTSAIRTSGPPATPTGTLQQPEQLSMTTGRPTKIATLVPRVCASVGSLHEPWRWPTDSRRTGFQVTTHLPPPRREQGVHPAQDWSHLAPQPEKSRDTSNP